MLNRRHLRIKVLQAMYAFVQSKEENYKRTEKELLNSIEKIHELYLYLMLTFTELKSVAERRIEENKTKRRPSEEDLNPNTKFVNNTVLSWIDSSSSLERASKDATVSWVGDDNREMFKKMYVQIKESESYFGYMNEEETSVELEKAFLIELFKEEIANSPMIYHFFEEKSIHWLDDIDLACSMVIKTIKGFNEDFNDIMPLYKDKDDELDFVKSLFRETIAMEEESNELIQSLTQNWELDRIAKMDVILMKMAITEMQVFSSVPTKVTLNEYIEISKFYSTPKSNLFINGILDKAIVKLNEKDKINKIGRGLIN
ncbi:MAG: N utilization substance protein B [Lentimonas sp.]|jgi:N utilization substance protein B